MAAGTKAKLVNIPGEVTAQASDGAGLIYLGTSKGDVIKYTTATKAVAKVGNVGRAIESMSLYSGLLYIARRGGMLGTMTTA